MRHDLLEVVDEVRFLSSCQELLLALFGIPVIAIVIGSLPIPVQDAMVLHIRSPTLWGAFFSNFVHASTAHLSTNLLAIILLILVIYPFAVLGQWKQELFISGAFFVLVVPFIVSGYSVVALQDTGAYTVSGLSGIGMSFAGFLPLVLFSFLREKISPDIKIMGSFGLIAIEIGLIFLVWSWQTVWMIGLILWGCGMLSVHFIGLSEVNRRNITHGGYLALIFFGLFVFMIVPVAFISFVDEGTNVFGHLIGFASGFLFPAIAILATTTDADWLDKAAVLLLAGATLLWMTIPTFDKM